MDRDRPILPGASFNCAACSDHALIDVNEAVAYAQMVVFSAAHSECDTSIVLTVPLFEE
jgi:hypothetical protein